MAISVGKVIRSFSSNEFELNYFLLGNDSFLQNFFISSLKKKISFSERAIYLNLKEESDLHFLIEQLNAVSLFSTKNIFVIRNFSQLSRKYQLLINSFIKRKNSEIILIFILEDYRITNKFCKSIADQLLLVDVQTPFYTKKIKEWIKYYLKQKKYNLNDNSIDLLINNYGNDMSNIINEIEKIILLGNDKNNNLDDDISNNRQINIWNLLDNLGDKKIDSSVNIFNNLLLNGFSIIPIIINLSILYIELLSNKKNNHYNGLNKIINSRLQKYRMNYTSTEISNIIIELRNLDIIVKSTSIKEDLLFIPFIIKVCKGKYG